MQHSQDSLESQVQKLEQRARQAEQELFSKNAEVQAAQDKLSDLKAEFERATSKLLKEQQETLKADASIALAQVKTTRKRLSDINDDIEVAHKLKLKTDKELGVAVKRLEDAYKAVEDAQNTLTNIRKEQEQADNALEAVRGQTITLEQSVSKLQTEEKRLLDSISDKEGILYNLEQQEVNARDTFLSAEALRKKKLQELDARLLVVVQEIEQKRADDDALRRSLAEWQARLEAQDQNLRIREMKVEEGETKIVRNSSLLNL